MRDHAADVARIARLIGIVDSYRDLTGRTIETSFESRLAILASLGFPVEAAAQAAETLDAIERSKSGMLPSTIAVRAGRATHLVLRGIGADTAAWRLFDESGGTSEGRAVLQGAEGGSAMPLPALSVGYFRLSVAAGGEKADTTVIAAPRRCWQPGEFRGDAKLWGVTAQVYALKSQRDLGIGDYTDIGNVAAACAGFGASFLGLSPLNALFSADRTKVSPYSPSSRLFLETIFIDPAAVPGFSESAAALLFDTDERRGRLEVLRSALLLDHAEIWRLKRELLDPLWAHFVASGEHSGFASFRRLGGRALQAHAAFEAISEHFEAGGHHWSGSWPAAFRDKNSPEVLRFEAENDRLVAFHAWLQWLADRQLAGAAALAHGSGMGIGLYRDLAVGADPSGSEVWTEPDQFAVGLSVGAPPDPFSPEGQNWGLPPFHPVTLQAQGLAAFRTLLAANMRHAGALRIDHAFQLERIFVIPNGMPAAMGTYLTYPLEAMLAALRVESHRARCLVIGEDLGTGPDGFSDAIMASGILSYRVLWFEREYGGAFKRPERYPRSSLAAVTTHDLPTFKGWWQGLDVDLRQALGIFDDARADRERGERSADVRRLTDALADEGLLLDREPPIEPPFESTMRFLARTPSVLVNLQLEDAAGERNQANLPGPEQGYPSWRRRLGSDIETITAADGDLARLSACLKAEGRGAKPKWRARCAGQVTPNRSECEP